MSAFEHVLVAVDFGDTSDDVMDVAIEMARKFDANLTILHAFFIYPLAYACPFYIPVLDVMREARATLDATVSAIRVRYPKVAGLLVRGEPWEEILQIATTHEVDLLILGTHGRRGLSRVFLGSVAEKVVRLSPVPVLIVSKRYESATKEQSISPITRAANTAPISCSDAR